MGFLAPLFLLGAVAVGVPIAVHLLRQLKRDPKLFSSLMFFERKEQSALRQRRLRYLALLAFRVAVVLLLALAFANPFVNRTSVLSGRRSLTVIAIDRSFSMRTGSRLEQAKRIADDLVDRLHGGDLAQIAAIDSQLENLTPPETDRAGLKSAIASIQASDRTSSFGQFARTLRANAAKNGIKLNVHLISDMQQTSMPSDFHDLPVGKQTSLFLHPVGERNAPNVAVSNVVAPVHVGFTGTTRVLATVKAWATKLPVTKQVSVLVDGKTAASKDVTVPPNAQAEVEFPNISVPYGEHRAEVRIEPHDELAADDLFPFALEHSEARKILFLYAANRSREDFFYKSAIDSAPDTGLSVESRSVENASNLDFSKFAFVVLSDVGEVQAPLGDALCAYIEKGGAVLIALGQQTARIGKIPLSTERFSEQSQSQGAGSLDSSHGATAGLARLENVRFSQTAWLSVKPAARVIARFEDGSPMLVEERAGEGRKLLFASALDNSTSDFPLHASFVPFVVRTARYLSGYEDAPSSVVIGTAISLRQSHGESAASADVIGPDGTHELSLNQASKALSFNTDRSGFYEVTLAGGRRRLLAVHPDRRESDLRSIPEETLDLWRHTGNTADRAETKIGETQTQPWGLWRFLIAVLIAVALVETIFANRYLTEERRM